MRRYPTAPKLSPEDRARAMRNKAHHNLKSGNLRSAVSESQERLRQSYGSIVESIAANKGQPKDEAEAKAAKRLTEKQADRWINSDAIYSKVTVTEVLADDRLRVLAARHHRRNMK